MPRGGSRPGSGRKPTGAVMKSIRVSPADWEIIKAKAKEQGLTITAYIIKKALQ